MTQRSRSLSDQKRVSNCRNDFFIHLPRRADCTDYHRFFWWLLVFLAENAVFGGFHDAKRVQTCAKVCHKCAKMCPKGAILCLKYTGIQELMDSRMWNPDKSGWLFDWPFDYAQGRAGDGVSRSDSIVKGLTDPGAETVKNAFGC